MSHQEMELLLEQHDSYLGKEEDYPFILQDGLNKKTFIALSPKKFRSSPNNRSLSSTTDLNQNVVRPASSPTSPTSSKTKSSASSNSHSPLSPRNQLVPEKALTLSRKYRKGQQPSQQHQPLQPVQLSENNSEIFRYPSGPTRRRYLSPSPPRITRQHHRAPSSGYKTSIGRSRTEPGSPNPYKFEIIANMITKESNEMIDPAYLEEGYRKITRKMRTLLIDWLVDVQVAFKLTSETLHLTIYLLDFYLFMNPQLTHEYLQLVGIASLLIASKFEEIHTPEPSDFVYIADNAYTLRMLTEMEMNILTTAKYKVGCVTSLFYLRYLTPWGLSKGEYYIAKFLLEVSFFSTELLAFKKITIACSAIYLTRRFLNKQPEWPPFLMELTTLVEDSLSSCASVLLTTLLNLIKSHHTTEEEDDEEEEEEEEEEATATTAEWAIVKKYSKGKYDNLLGRVLLNLRREKSK